MNKNFNNIKKNNKNHIEEDCFSWFEIKCAHYLYEEKKNKKKVKRKIWKNNLKKIMLHWIIPVITIVGTIVGIILK